MKSSSEIERGVAVLIQGTLRPIQIHPLWLESQGIIGREDALAAKIETIHPAVTSFQLPWVRVEAQEDALRIICVDKREFGRTRDLAASTLSALKIEEASALSITHWVHIGEASDLALHDLGDLLVPKGPWSEVLKVPGLTSVEVQGVRPDTFGGFLTCKVEPSRKHDLAVFLEFVDQFDLRTGVIQPNNRDELNASAASFESNPDKVAVAIEVLYEEWDASIERANRAFDHMAKVAK